MKVQSQITSPGIVDGALRIAFASTDGAKVNQHFGKGMEFWLFDVSKEGFKKSGKITFTPDEDDDAEHVEKNFVKADALADCHIVYSLAIGGPVAAKLTQRKIQPLVVKEEDRIEALLGQFKDMLGSAKVPPWIAKMVNAETDLSRFDAYDEDDDDEEE
ncbi:MAG: NifB/NifX family molybdenum-iron cluster-binding protein [bacterium]|nr:NifB/NifX family molybdenum-iron cluster-binding protein [bacterium]